MGSKGRHRCRVGNYPGARPALGGGGGGVPKPCDLRGCRLRARRKCAVCGCFPPVRLEVRGTARKWVSSPGESCICTEDGYSQDG